MKNIYLLIGRTASGKSSIAKALTERYGYKQVKSYTTRQPREEEKIYSADHYFVSNEEFNDIYYKQEVVAFTEINGIRYCATKSELDASNIYVIDPAGVEDLKRRCGDEYNFIEIYIFVPKSINKRRYIQRGEDMAAFMDRYNKESAQFAEYEANQKWHYHLLNDGKLKYSVDKVAEWIAKEESKR